MVPAETVQEMQEAGFFRVLQPKRYGGYEMDPQVFYDVCMTLAEGCMSTAWIYGVIGVHNWQIALFDPKAAEDVFGKDSNTRIARSEEHTSELQSLMRISYAVFCLKKKR